MIIVPEAANMPPTLGQTEILAPGNWGSEWQQSTPSRPPERVPSVGFDPL
jgi:hypothetical protein